MGNRVYKASSAVGNRKYIVDISGDLPTILMELDPQDNMAIKKTYIYADSQILAQHNGSYSAPRYFYLHDRLGSVRLVINSAGDVNNTYTYNSFGEMFPTECNETVSNPFKFSGQFFDDEIGQYYLRARQYDPYISRFISSDPAFGKFEQPMTLHKYLYCGNNPINGIDPSGLWMVDRWQGHAELTYRSMQQMGFSLEQISWAIVGSAWTDYREDHFPWSGNNSVPHYTYGLEAEAEAHATGAMELSLALGLRGDSQGSMLMLGTGLHTLQDRWAHAEQGGMSSKWLGHYPGCLTCPWPDNPEAHRGEYRSAYAFTNGALLTYLQDRGDKITDIDRSGAIGNGFTWSNPTEDFALGLVELSGRIANARDTDWLE